MAKQLKSDRVKLMAAACAVELLLLCPNLANAADLYGLTDRSGRFVIPAKYTRIEPLENGQVCCYSYKGQGGDAQKPKLKFAKRLVN